MASLCVAAAQRKRSGLVIEMLTSWSIPEHSELCLRVWHLLCGQQAKTHILEIILEVVWDKLGQGDRLTPSSSLGSLQSKDLTLLGKQVFQVHTMTVRNLSSQVEFHLRTLNRSQVQAAADSHGGTAVTEFSVFWITSKSLHSKSFPENHFWDMWEAEEKIC